MIKRIQISNIIALIITIVINYFSNTGAINNNTMASVSMKYQNLFTPSGYAFSIWGVIYLFLIAFVIYQSKGLFSNEEPHSVVRKIGWWFVISCVANSIWVFVWLYEFTGLSVIVMVVLLFSLVKIVRNTRMELDLIAPKRIALEWWPFAIYIGWISVALIANIAAYLTKLEWNGFGLPNVYWAIIMICIAGIVNIIMIWERNLRESAMVGIWALVAVAHANQYGIPNIAQTALAISVIIFINVAIHAYRNFGRHYLKG
tara:strand:+ start:49 stop:825 length:777 start_codon:yes stop_codon:yes gene_type:complete